jgi:hypothetical protein
MVHDCNLTTWETEQEDLKFETSMGYIGKLCLKQKKILKNINAVIS